MTFRSMAIALPSFGEDANDRGARADPGLFQVREDGAREASSGAAQEGCPPGTPGMADQARPPREHTICLRSTTKRPPPRSASVRAGPPLPHQQVCGLQVPVRPLQLPIEGRSFSSRLRSSVPQDTTSSHKHPGRRKSIREWSSPQSPRRFHHSGRSPLGVGRRQGHRSCKEP